MVHSFRSVFNCNLDVLEMEIPKFRLQGGLFLLTESALSSEIQLPDAPSAPQGAVSAPTPTVSALTRCPKIWCEARAVFRSGAPLCFDKAC